MSGIAKNIAGKATSAVFIYLSFYFVLMPFDTWQHFEKETVKTSILSTLVSFQLCLFGSDVLIRNKIQPHTIFPLIIICLLCTITTYLTSLLKHSSLSHTLICINFPTLFVPLSSSKRKFSNIF